MEPSKPSFLRNVLVKAFLFCVIMILFRFAYVVTLRGESCDLGDFCFFSKPEALNPIVGTGKIAASSAIISVDGEPKLDLYTRKEWRKAVDFYSSIFQDLIAEGYLDQKSKALCVETLTGQDVFALKEIGVKDTIGISKKASPPLVTSGQTEKLKFKNNSFDFVFSGNGMIDQSKNQMNFAEEITRTLKPEGFLVIHTVFKDTYSFNSLLDLFSSCELIRFREIHGFDSSMPEIREIVFKKLPLSSIHGGIAKFHGNLDNKCFVPEHKRELVRSAEPLIVEEPLKPWITLKRNIKNVKYLPSMVDISYKPRYVYIDVGARGYGSSIVSWFKKQYPKQNKTFEVYAIEADKSFHEEYKTKKGVKLLPYAAWVRNETLSFEISHNPDPSSEERGGRGMGRIQPVKSKGSSVREVDKIQGFDFANWVKNTVSEQDFVVMKMDVEGTEFDLIPRLFETGAICLIDEIFLECHYNRWQKCCPGQRSSKYEKTYGQCLDLLNSLRESGVLVHQWW
ncbi:Methyltransferase type 11 [Dillenia turbinata]|uniref:Methyltransferase type 11 n=1 Tax=Dillenia turbinata TaxID=194707 RepID=A0AAN8W4R4_9MAGN